LINGGSYRLPDRTRCRSGFQRDRKDSNYLSRQSLEHLFQKEGLEGKMKNDGAEKETSVECWISRRHIYHLFVSPNLQQMELGFHRDSQRFLQIAPIHRVLHLISLFQGEQRRERYFPNLMSWLFDVNFLETARLKSDWRDGGPSSRSWYAPSRILLRCTPEY
jgi:hypothetical protein